MKNFYILLPSVVSHLANAERYLPALCQKRKARGLRLVMVLMLIWTTSPLFAQTTWTGAANMVWTNASNWSAGVPDASDDVRIPDVKTNPIISAAGALAKTISIESGGILTISATGTVALNGSGNWAILNNGTLTTSGSITSSGAASIGIDNYAVFNNTGGQIIVNNCTGHGLFNGGSFTNTGSISIGNLSTTGVNGLLNTADFHNNTGGQINIDRSSGRGIWNDIGGNFTNQATITIGAIASTGIWGLQNNATFSNNNGGQITIDRATDVALFNNGGNFTNQQDITIGALAGNGNSGIRNQAAFNNTAGTIRIDQSGSSGIWNDTGGALTNRATMLIGTTTSTGLYGIFNTATLNNDNGGQISIDRSTSIGFRNTGTCSTRGIITIGSTASVGEIGLVNEANFNNNSGGQIMIDRFTNDGIKNYSTFINEATITIGSVATTGTNGIYNSAIFNNNTGGQIKIDRCALSNFTDGTFANQAMITLGASVSPGLIALRNLSIFSNDTGGLINIDRSTFIGINNYSNSTFTNHATINIGMKASAGSNGIQNNSLFNNSAGEININNATSEGIWNAAGATFNNLTTINIGPISTGNSCLSNDGNFNNNDGQINMNGSPLYGLSNDFNATFTNKSAITIGSTSGATYHGIHNNGTFSNNAGSPIQIDRSGNTGIYNSASFINAGDITLGTIAGVGLYGIANTSAFNNNGTGVIKIDRCTTYGIDNQDRFINNATLTIGGTSSVGTYGIRAFGQLTNSGQIKIDRTTSAGIAVIAGGHRFENSGTVRIGVAATVGAYGIYIYTGSLFNEPDGHVYIDHADSGIYAENNGVFDNSGDVTIGMLTPVKNGLVNMLYTTRSSPIFRHFRGTVKGSGTLSQGYLLMGGTLAPGNSPGTMTIESPENGFSYGTIVMEVNGAGTPGVDYDQIIGLGTVNLKNIKLALSINYTPVNGDRVTILTGTARTNSFEEISGLPENWVVNYTSTSVILSYGSGPLPVSLVSFTGKKNTDNQNNIQWITANEKDFDRFDIQRSLDAKSFETLGVLLGQRNINNTEGGQIGQALHSYYFIDKAPDAFKYYRLKMVDLDGTFQYSRIISIEDSAERAVVGSFYPNPSGGKVFMDVFAVESGRWTINIFDAGGKSVSVEVYDLQKGMNKISLNRLPMGMSLVHFEHGLFSEVRKVIRE